MVQVQTFPDEAIVRLIIPETLSEADTQGYLRSFEAALATDHPFGVIFSYSGGRPRKARAAELLEREWLRHHRAELSQRCFGIAMVATPSLLAVLSKIVLRGIGARMFGCPCAQVLDLDEAREWLKGQRATHRAAAATAPAPEGH